MAKKKTSKKPVKKKLSTRKPVKPSRQPELAAPLYLPTHYEAPPQSKKLSIGKIAAAAAVLVFASLLFTYFLYPRALLGIVYKIYEFRAGVSEKTIDVDGYSAGYLEGGSGPALVLLHGFGDSRISFAQSSRYLTDRYRVIMPDLPGFGATAHDVSRNYSIQSQVVFLHKFLKKLGIGSFFLGGNSMGGHISAAYTLRYPEQVKALILIAAAGLQVRDPTPYRQSLKRIETEADFDAFIDKTFVKKPFIPRPFKDYMIESSARDFEWLNRIRSDIRAGGDYILNNRIRNIRRPTMVLYGDRDLIVEPDVSRLYLKSIRGSKAVVFTNCGHAPQYEEVERTAQEIRDFLATVKE